MLVICEIIAIILWIAAIIVLASELRRCREELEGRQHYAEFRINGKPFVMPEEAAARFCEREVEQRAIESVTCRNCGHRWVAIYPYPVGVEKLECPECGEFT